MSTFAILIVKGKVRFLNRFSEVSGAKITCAENGKQVGTVESVVCAGDDRVLGLLLQTGGIKNRYGFICVEDILKTRRGEFCIFNEESIQKNKKLIQKYRKEGTWKWLNKKAVTPEGTLLGTISDGLFDVGSGKISQVELSLGVMEDLREGRRRFFLAEDTEFGTEALVLKEDGGQYE